MACTETIYLQSAENLVIRLGRIESIIDALELLQISVIPNSDKKEYMLDDGQTRIQTEYRSAKEIAGAIEAYDKLANKIRNKLNGRNMVLRPAQGFRR